MQASLTRLRAAGVRMALDDFGTGYSSMNYLRRYNIDKLKIDRSFVSQLGTSEDTNAIIAAMIGLAHAMRMQVTAEGVETEAQREALVALGCGELQGFLLARPLSSRRPQVDAGQASLTAGVDPFDGKAGSPRSAGRPTGPARCAAPTTISASTLSESSVVIVCVQRSLRSATSV